ncbi:PDR/VanB family oxidoreductase [Mesorhizobium sp.]|uniref:PDR/VanB family oxidoreductase n=1 Tax=Mesorhizobium sp. TaxID=1871066 RepID=UPI0025EFD069|nr:PDR/VanB family oxidoreductase [Mesorhizobium sp.]
MLLEPINGRLPDWKAGAHVYVHLPSGKTRQYSLTGDPSIRDCYRLAVKLEEGGGGGSREMHQLAIGCTVEISGPINNFALVPSTDPHLLIAGGIGITPLLSMAYVLERAGRSWRMVVCGRSPDSMPFLKELSGFPPESLILIYTYGEPGHRLAFEDLFSSMDPKTQVYLCGSGRFNHSAAHAFRTSASRTARLVYESFSGSQQSITPAENGFFVELALTGRKLWVPRDKSILEVVEAAGVRVESVCREGYCGTCVVHVLEGSPTYRDDNLFTDEERSSQKVMTLCRCRSNGDLRISL